MTRAEVAKSILKTLQQAHAPKVYGFINARKLEQHPEDMDVLKLWRSAGFPLANHTYAHLSLNASTAQIITHSFARRDSRKPFLMSGLRTLLTVIGGGGVARCQDTTRGKKARSGEPERASKLRLFWSS
jgi:hypothetical protein